MVSRVDPCDPTSAGGTIRIQGLNFARNHRGVAKCDGPGGRAQPHFGGLSDMARKPVAQDGVNADQVEAQLLEGIVAQSLSKDGAGQLRAFERTRSRIGDLPFAHKPVEIPGGDFQRAGALRSLTARHQHAIIARVREGDTGEVRHDIRGEIGGGVLDFVEELFSARGSRNQASGAGHLGDDGRTVLGNFGQRKPQPGEAWNILVAGVGEIAAGDLARAFQ